MLRRDFLTSLLALAGSPALGQISSGEPGLTTGRARPFTAQTVTEMARTRASGRYMARGRIPDEWTNITYDDYRSIWFDGRNALWEGERDTPLRMDVFAPGLYFPEPIQIYVVEGDQAAPLLFDLNVFDKTDKFPELPLDESLGYSGFRLRSELEKPGIYQEFAVFQGASYFRAIGTGDIYGLSARGLSLNTASPKGEEFPSFEAFWIEKPATGSNTFIVHALLDSPSIAGAYRFAIQPDQPLRMEVEATLFPRIEVDNVGVAPITSMFHFDQTNRDRFSDFRPAVHDSDGLLIRNGAGETIWRPLANPRDLQISAFVDNAPKGFGLMQRARRFSDFADLEALYHRRPGLWIEPKGDWGRGSVTLVEIPTDKEIYDNIVTYWRPSSPWQPGEEHNLAYDLTWGDDSYYGTGLRVMNTAIGNAFESGIIVAIDFEAGPEVPDDLSGVTHMVRGSAGDVSDGVLQRNPETGGPRLAFKFHPGDASLIEFRAALRLNGAPLSETWLYRWTA